MMNRYDELMQQKHDIKRMIKELEAQEKTVDNELVILMESDNITQYHGRDHDITLVDSVSMIFNSEAFKRDHEVLYNQYKNKERHTRYLKLN